MAQVTDKLKENWSSRLLEELPEQSEATREGIIQWLLGEDQEKFETLNSTQLAIASQGMDYRYRILQQRYFKVHPNQSYRNLLRRLGSIVVLRNKIRAWVAMSRERQKGVTEVLQEVIQEMINSDRHIQAQARWINRCISDKRLRNSLLFASIEEYSLRPIRNKPLLLYRFVNFLNRQAKSGITQVPQQEKLRLLSEEVVLGDDDSAISLLDSQAILDYEAAQEWEEQQGMRLRVQQEFEAYLERKVGAEAVEWLRLYLKGMTQEAIAQQLELPIKQAYRLREKVTYHGINVFAIKEQSQLVANWLKISLQEHNFGLTPSQWETFLADLNPVQRKMIEASQSGESLEAIAKSLKLKKTQVTKEWRELYLKAQEIRN